MDYLVIPALALAGLVILVGAWLGWQLLRQNGRILLRLDELENRLNEMEYGEPDSRQSGESPGRESGVGSQKSAEDQSLVTSATTSRFSNRSLARSKIKRDGLKAGTPAPDFRLPRLDGRGELALEALRGRRVLLVFSDPHCGPCNTLAPELETLHRGNRIEERSPSPRPGDNSFFAEASPAAPGEGDQLPALEVLMVSRGEPKENRAKVKEHGLTFPIVLQQRWEISRRYAMFATPIAYLIDEDGVISHDVAVGTDAILSLMSGAERLFDETSAVASR